MYPFAHLKDAYDQYWAAVALQLPWVPVRLDEQLALPDQWAHPDLVAAQTCGWPLVTRLGTSVRVVGAFQYAIPEARGERYRSTLIARSRRDTFVGATAAVNAPDSLSGWVSLVTAIEGIGGRWCGRVVPTGSHLESIRLVHEGRADIASIDSVTLAHIAMVRPALTNSLITVGFGPWVPSLPVITAVSTTDEQLSDLRSALAAAIADAPQAAATLRIHGFAPLDLDAYLPLLALRPAE
jgi:ABC-type phosphate/phosphonate transport system substrate-binding protein